MYSIYSSAPSAYSRTASSDQPYLYQSYPYQPDYFSKVNLENLSYLVTHSAWMAFSQQPWEAYL
jgi:hypothetical protein